MAEREFVNAVEMRPYDAGRLVEFTTMCTHEMEADGHGETGSQVTFRGRVVTVANGMTFGRGWSQITLDPDDGMPRVTSVLGGHRHVELLPEPGSADRP
ncbi:hypothetical protein ABIA33_001411 [Streptacidiphilus sp. MAP12-16]|uniref:hypothetical protein n=1 Tax=Streptacidiphilus sp. MAP12-16 TaxID=3156300 RepID=UPI003514DAFD